MTADKRTEEMVGGVLFDAAGTLFAMRPSLAEVVAELIARHGGPRAVDRVEDAIDYIGSTLGWPDDQPTHAARVAAWAAFVEKAVRSSGIEGVNHCRAAVAEQAAVAVTEPQRYLLFPETSAVLSRLAEARVPMGIVSNFDDLLFDILRATGLDQAFPVVVTSHRVGVYKPDPLIFSEALSATRMNPEHTYYVGDSLYSDMEGARRSGLRGVLVDRYDAHTDYDGTRVTSLLGLYNLLGI